MRAPALAISIWMFISMTILGVIGYAYVLWTQYWRTVRVNQHYMVLRVLQQQRNTSYKRLSNYNLEAPTSNPVQPIVIATNYPTRETPAIAPVPLDKLLSKIKTYQNELIVQLRKSQLENRNANFAKNKQNSENHYNVHFKKARVKSYKPAGELICEAKKSSRVNMLNRRSDPFFKLGLGDYFPQRTLEEALGRFNTCAIISSAGSMHKSKLGAEIDGHDAILRFNTAPTVNYEDDVGSKTTIRLLNSQVVSKPEFDFFGSSLYRNVTLIVWDPSKYHGTLEEWFKKPEFDLFTPYWLRRKLFPVENFYIADPDDVWTAWDFIQSNTPSIVEHNPPSSGFLGLLIMLDLCDVVDVYEFVPSMRLTKQCHYFDVHEDIGCTFGNWHPLASEKLLGLAMNTASDIDVFLTGKMTFKGFRQLEC